MAFVDGSVVDGRIVVILHRGGGEDGDGPGTATGAGEGGGPSTLSSKDGGDNSVDKEGFSPTGAPKVADTSNVKLSKQGAEEAAKAQAASVAAAAEDGAPFCAVCEQAKKLKQLEAASRS